MVTSDPVGDLCGVLGEPALRRIVREFYARVPGDDLLGPMYPADDLAGAEARLGDFLIERCGGPPHYSSARGHPRLRMRHGRFAVTQAARDRWMALMTAALDACEVAAEPRARLEGFLGDVASFLRNRAE